LALQLRQEAAVKRLIALSVLLIAVASAPIFALDTRTGRNRHKLIDDVIRMSQAGVSDDAIISFVLHTRDDFEVTADDVIAMTNAHVSNEVVKVVVDEAAARKDDVDRRRVAVAPDEADAYVPFFPYYYDPNWYLPRYYNAGGAVTNRQTAASRPHENGSTPKRISVLMGGSSKGGRK
jgi:hypothetical protein